MAHDDTNEPADIPRPWLPAPPGRLIGRGHPAGDFLEAYDWQVLDAAPGRFRIEAHLPRHVRNPRGQLFGGFTPTYVDMLAVRTAHSASGSGSAAASTGGFRGVATVSMHVDYFDPVVDDRFLLESRVVHTRGRILLVEVTFRALDDTLLVFATTTLRLRGG